MKNIFIISCAILFCFSCSKKELKPNDTNADSKNMARTAEGEEVDNVANITISSTSVNGKLTQLDIIGEFTEDGKLVPISKLLVNGKDIKPGNDNRYYEFYSTRDNSLERAEELIGKDISISASGYSKGDIEVVQYNPQQIKADIDQSASAINTSLPLTISWNADPKNENPVIITLINRGISGPEFDPKVEIPNVYYQVQAKDADGKVVIPASEMSKFPASSLLDINISRGSQKIVTNKDETETNVTFFTNNLVTTKTTK